MRKSEKVAKYLQRRRMRAGSADTATTAGHLGWCADPSLHARARVPRSVRGAVQVESLPPYAPELNPAEYIWGHLKHHELPNRCAINMTDLKTQTRGRLRSVQHRQTLVRAFWRKAELAL